LKVSLENGSRGLGIVGASHKLLGRSESRSPRRDSRVGRALSALLPCPLTNGR